MNLRRGRCRAKLAFFLLQLGDLFLDNRYLGFRVFAGACHSRSRRDRNTRSLNLLRDDLRRLLYQADRLADAIVARLAARRLDGCSSCHNLGNLDGDLVFFGGYDIYLSLYLVQRHRLRHHANLV